MEPLTHRQMADEIKAIGMEKADTLEKARAKRRPAEMLAITQWKIEALRQIWVLLDRLAKGEGTKPTPITPPTAAAPEGDDDDDF